MDDKRALELYKVFRDYASVGPTSLYSTLSHYLALIAAILGGSLVAASAAISRTSTPPSSTSRARIKTIKRLATFMGIPFCLLADGLPARSIASLA